MDDAGISAGMRVIDIGCGPDEVSFRLARLVGANGIIYGVDRDAAMLALARERLRQLQISNLEFMQGGFDADLPGHGGFDTAVGRRILMYQQPDPGAAAVATLAGAVRPGGLLVFQEHDATLVSDGRAGLPLYDQVRAVI